VADGTGAWILFETIAQALEFMRKNKMLMHSFSERNPHGQTRFFGFAITQEMIDKGVEPNSHFPTEYGS
jgi:hypothetical protein